MTTSGARAKSLFGAKFTCDTFSSWQCEKPSENMEELNDINFLAVIEGRDFEHSLKKIVSILFHALLNLSPMGIHRKGSELDDTRTNSLIFAHRVSRSFTSHP